jgi:hypothetical protein
MAARSFLMKTALLSMVLVIAFAAWTPAFASTYTIKAGTVEFGKQGVYIAKPGSNAAKFTIVRQMPQYMPSGNHWRMPVLKLTFLDSKGKTIAPDGDTYIYFNLGKAEYATWKASGSKGMSIWVYSGKAWSTCPTTWAKAGAYGRLVCRITANGYYALGGTDYKTDYYTKK